MESRPGLDVHDSLPTQDTVYLLYLLRPLQITYCTQAGLIWAESCFKARQRLLQWEMLDLWCFSSEWTATLLLHRTQRPWQELPQYWWNKECVNQIQLPYSSPQCFNFQSSFHSNNVLIFNNSIKILSCFFYYMKTFFIFIIKKCSLNLLQK